ncbi:MAG: hypothetical protein KDM64_03220 [Verrucomicrobiae bacterium]|nr:hypothetical protein [Verrucomicrobiae bacterium]
MIVLAVVGHQQEKKRQAQLQAFARSRSWYFHPEKVRGFDAKYLEFDFLDRGSNRYAHNILSGREGDFEIEGFDYHYETHTTDSKGKRQTHHHRFSVAILEPGFPLKDLTIRPEGLFDKLSAAFGWDDINFESAEFSRRFHVKAQDRRWAYDVIHPRAMEYLLECPRYELHFSRGRLAVRSSGRFEPWEFAKAIEMGDTMLRGIPEFARESA